MDNTSDGGALLTQTPRYSARMVMSSNNENHNFGYGNNGYKPLNGILNNITNGCNNGYEPNHQDFDFADDDNLLEYQPKPQYEKFAKRTVQLINLPDNVTHADLVNAVRGGMLLDIYLRSQDHSASVSFLEENDAMEYFRRVKRNNLYIRSKRVGIRWNDRQFILPGHVASKIGIGATRNLVVQNIGPRYTEEAIRKDLEHIHNLIVIKVTFRGQHAYISTNSVHNAMFARTCMMSRTTYKGSRIDWDVDECATAFEETQPAPRHEVPAKKKLAPVTNRFELLNMDRTEDGSSDDEDASSGITLHTTLSTTTAT